MSSRQRLIVALALGLSVACTGKSNTTEQNQPTSVGPAPKPVEEGSGTDPNKPNPVGATPGQPMGSASAGPGAGTAPPLDAGVDAKPKGKETEKGSAKPPEKGSAAKPPEKGSAAKPPEKGSAAKPPEQPK